MTTCIHTRTLIGTLILGSAHLALASVTLGQVDTFQNGTTLLWGGGANPTNIATGGPSGEGDRYLRIVSTGGAGSGSNLATPNTSQWSGNYLSAGVTVIEADLFNPSSSDLAIRVVLFSGFDRWTSIVPQTLPSGSGWRRVRFELGSEALVRVQGTGSYNTAISGVTQLMIRHQSGTPQGGGTPISATLGIDNITASAGRKVAGTIEFGDYGGLAAQSVLVEFRVHDQLDVIRSEVVMPDIDGQFSVFAPPIPGDYDIAVKGSHWLRKTLRADTTAGDVSGLSFTLVNGDVDGDNAVTVFDYSLLSDAFDTVVGDANWNPAADLDGDEAVTVFDYSILSDNFDMVGDD